MSEKISKKKQPTKPQEIVKAKDELMALPDCVPTYTSLNISPGISEERLEKIGEFLFTLKRKGTLQFWFGDFCIFCEDNNRALSKLDVFYYSDRTIKNIVWVCRQIEPARRRVNLSFAHHQVVAPLSSEKQDFWLEEAERLVMSVKELRRRVKEMVVDFEKEEYLTNNKDAQFIYISTNDYVYNYSEYINLLNSSTKKLLNKVRTLLEKKMYYTINPQYCKTDEEREFTKNCSRLFWELERLLGEHLSKLTLLKDSPFDKPLLLEDVYMGFPAFTLTERILSLPWVNKYMKNSFSDIYPHECLFAECRKLADLLNTDVRLLSKNFEKLFKIYDDDGDVMGGGTPLNIQVDGFKFTCYALILNLIGLCKVINEYFPNPLDKETVEKLKKHLFDSGMEDEKKKSKIEGKVKELLEIIFEE